MKPVSDTSLPSPMWRRHLKTLPRTPFQFDNRYIAPLFITCILLVGHLHFRHSSKATTRPRWRSLPASSPS